MARKTPVPVTGEVLEWAISDAALGIPEFAERVGVTETQVKRWIAEEERPGKSEFRRITEVLKRPSAFFLLPEPPKAQTTADDFRSAPGLEEHALTNTEAREIRSALRIQEITSWALQELDREPIPLAHSALESSPDRVASRERNRLGVPLEEQTSWHRGSASFKRWKRILEDRGFLVFQLPLGQDGSRGFSIWDDYAPVISVNSAYNFTARVFTLFHEYAHLLLREDGVCYTYNFENQVERWCEQFAASFLLPREEVLRYLEEELGWTDDEPISEFSQVKDIAYHFRVSLRATAVRLIHLDAANQQLYNHIAQVAGSEFPDRSEGGPGWRRHERNLHRFGSVAPRALLEAVDADQLSLHEFVEALDISTSHLDEVRAALESAGGE